MVNSLQGTTLSLKMQVFAASQAATRRSIPRHKVNWDATPTMAPSVVESLAGPVTGECGMDFPRQAVVSAGGAVNQRHGLISHRTTWLPGAGLDPRSLKQ